MVNKIMMELARLRAQNEALREALSGLMLTSEKADICLPVLINILKAGELNWEIAQEHLDGLRAAMPSARAALAATEE